MAVDLSTIGTSGPEETVSWTVDDTLLYAIGLGMGENPTENLQFTTENSHDTATRAVPTMAVLLGHRAPLPPFGEIAPGSIVHGGQEVRWDHELPPEGEAKVRTTILDIEDKGSGALVSMETIASALDGRRIFSTVTRLFARGHGGFGRKPASSAGPLPGEGEPDFSFKVRTRPDQALIYRLSGDRNPLHSDPWFAARAGFPRPILHGLCTYGIAARVLLEQIADADPSRFVSISARFAKPVLPGDELTVHAWTGDARRALFRVIGAEGEMALDQGVLELR